MSVVGEYRRILADLLALLEGSSAPEAGAFGRALASAELERAPNVSTASERALAILDTQGADATAAIPNVIERERIAEQVDHFAAICRVVLGR